MSQKVQIVVLCEDLQTYSFARRYLLSKNFDEWRIRKPVVSPPAKGSAYSYVLQVFPHELAEMRKDSVARELLAVIDDDSRGRTLQDFNDACRKANIAPRTKKEAVAILIPKRNIETWLYFLQSGERVSEDKDYKRQIHRNKRCVGCTSHVETLNELCRLNNDRSNWPPSLSAACAEIQHIL